MLIRLSALAVAAASIVNGLSPADIPSDLPLSNLLASAQSHLSKGETGDALIYYDAAIARDPSNYLTFFKRATTYLSLGRTSQATDDFNKVLALKPGFEGAHIQLGKLKARGADWDAAREHYEKAKKVNELVALEDAAVAAGLAEKAAASGDWEECVTQAGAAIMVANRAVALRQLRSKCLFERGDLEMGMSDLQHILQMKPGDTTPHLKISAISFYALGDLPGGLAAIRKCLHSDPDSKVCAALLKEEKMTDKLVQKAIKALNKKQPMTAVKNLVPNREGEGLIQEVKSQVEKLRADGTIPNSAGNVLVGQLVELACQAYFEVSRLLKRPPKSTSVWNKVANTSSFSPVKQQKSLHLLRRVASYQSHCPLCPPVPIASSDRGRRVRRRHRYPSKGPRGTPCQIRRH